MRHRIVLLMLFCVCGPGSNAFAAVVISFDETYADVSNGSTSVPNNLNNTGGTVVTATLPGYSSATTSSFSQTLMSRTFNQARGGDLYGYTLGLVVADFTPDTNVSYAAVGNYSSTGGYTSFVSYLYDYTTNSYVYYSEQDSIGVPANFILGGAAGNYNNSLFGSLSGSLLAGHDYQWTEQAYTQAYPNADGGALASGEASFTIGAVPETSSMIVWSMLGLTIGGACWWKQTPAASG